MHRAERSVNADFYARVIGVRFRRHCHLQTAKGHDRCETAKDAARRLPRSWTAENEGNQSTMLGHVLSLCPV